jgi:hypothetical protein
MNMQPTLTQNSALYFAQHKASKRRATLFRPFHIAARKEHLGARQLTFGDTYIARRLHQNNGR